MTSRLHPAGSGEERGLPPEFCDLVRLEQIEGGSIEILVNGDAKHSCDMAKIFELEVVLNSLLEKLDVIEMSNKNQVINLDGEDNSAVSCVEAKCTVQLILVGLIVLA